VRIGAALLRLELIHAILIYLGADKRLERTVKGL